MAVTVTMPERPTYGAIEIKELIKKYTIRGYIYTVLIFGITMGGYMATVNMESGSGKKLKLAPIQKIKLDQLPPPQSDAPVEAPPPQQVQQIIQSGPAARAGTPVPVPDAEITPDMQDFAAMDVMSRASAEGGDGEDLGGFADNIDFDAPIEVEAPVEEPDPDEFIAVEEEVKVDLPTIQKMVKYPDLARRAGVEGTVYIKVLVDKSGKAKKTIVEMSDNELLNKAAVEAVMNYKGYVPAIQNGQPVTMWLSIPIEFRLN